MCHRAGSEAGAPIPSRRGAKPPQGLSTLWMAASVPRCSWCMEGARRLKGVSFGIKRARPPYHLGATVSLL